MSVETTPCISGRNFDEAAKAAADLANRTSDSVLLSFDDVAVQVDPGDSLTAISRNYDETLANVRRRLTPTQPLVSDAGRTPTPGDLIETQIDDHFTRLMKNTVGIVTNVDVSNDEVSKVVVRFARRTVDFVPEDFPTLRYFR